MRCCLRACDEYLLAGEKNHCTHALSVWVGKETSTYRFTHGSSSRSRSHTVHFSLMKGNIHTRKHAHAHTHTHMQKK